MSEKGGTDTAEYRAFKACTPQLVGVIKGDLGIAAKLLAKQLISEDTYDDTLTYSLANRIKAETLVMKIREKIKENKAGYAVFCAILNDKDSKVYYENLLTELKEQREAALTTQMKTMESYSNFYGWKAIRWCTCIAVVIGILAVSVNVLSPPVQLREHEHQPIQHNFPQDLMKYYRELPEIDYDQYLPGIIKNRYIPFIVPNIRPVEQYNRRPRNITLEKMLSEVTAGTRIAITGRPGVGKSTLARHIVRSWAERKVLRNFSSLFHICLGRVTTRINGLQALLEEECHGMITAGPNIELSKHIESTHGNGVVFILDAFDEYFTSQSEQKDYVYKLIKNISLHKSAIVLTSRPRKLDDRNFQKYFNQTVELVGFDEADIGSSLFKLDPPLGPVIRRYFDQNPHVKKICYLPLHMTMIIYLASLKHDKLSLIDSETKIYSNFLYLTIDHYNARHGLNAYDLDNCFKRSSVESQLCTLFINVCEISFNATIHQRQTFNSSEIRISSDQLEALSLFNIVKESRRQGSVDIFFFSHQTFQEFLAAYHLAMLSEEEQIDIIIKYQREQPIFSEIVWKFFFGILGGKSKEQATTILAAFVSNSGYEQMESYYYAVDLYPFTYAYEIGHRYSSFSALLDVVNITGPGNNYSLAIHINKTVQLNTLVRLIEGKDEAFCLKQALRWTPIKTLRMELQISSSPDPKLTTKEYCDIVRAQKKELRFFDQSYFCQPTQLSEDWNIILELGYWSKQYPISTELLIELFGVEIYLERVRVEYLQSILLQYISNGMDYLKTRPSLMRNRMGELYRTGQLNITSNVTEDEPKYINMFHTLDKRLAVDTNFRSLNLAGLRRLKFKCSSARDFYLLRKIGQYLKSTKRLEVLDLSSDRLHDIVIHLDEVTFLSDRFKHLQYLKELDLSGLKLSTFISNISMETFVDNMVRLKRLKSLNLSRVFGMYSTSYKTTFLSKLNKISTLKILNVSRCDINHKEFVPFMKSLRFLPKLEVLDISHNSIGYLEDEDLKFIAGFPNITEINISGNRLMLPLVKIIPLLQPSLRKLDLSHNLLCASENDLNLFFQYVERFPELKEIDLSYNMIFLGDGLQYSANKAKPVLMTNLHLEGSEYIPNTLGQRHAASYCHKTSYCRNLGATQLIACHLTIIRSCYKHPQFLCAHLTQTDAINQMVDHFVWLNFYFYEDSVIKYTRIIIIGNWMSYRTQTR